MASGSRRGDDLGIVHHEDAKARSPTRIIAPSEDSSFQSVFDDFYIEIDQEAEAFVGELQVSQQLSLEDWDALFDGFHFDDHLFLDEEVDAKFRVERHAVVHQRHRYLPPDPKS